MEPHQRFWKAGLLSSHHWHLAFSLSPFVLPDQAPELDCSSSFLIGFRFFFSAEVVCELGHAALFLLREVLHFLCFLPMRESIASAWMQAGLSFYCDACSPFDRQDCLTRQSWTLWQLIMLDAFKILFLKEHWMTVMMTYGKQLRLQDHFYLWAGNEMAESAKGLFIMSNNFSG